MLQPTLPADGWIKILWRISYKFKVKYCYHSPVIGDPSVHCQLQCEHWRNAPIRKSGQPTYPLLCQKEAICLSIALPCSLSQIKKNKFSTHIIFHRDFCVVSQHFAIAFFTATLWYVFLAKLFLIVKTHRRQFCESINTFRFIDNF